MPDFVRASLARLGVPGCKVLRWEREWHAPGQPFIDPATYPPVSAAMTGTHDTEPLAGVVGRGAADGRAPAFVALPPLRAAGLTNLDVSRGTTPCATRCSTRSGAAGSNELFLPMQDVFGWRDRINTPGTVSDDNWTWRLPWPVDRLDDVPEARARVLQDDRLARRHEDMGAGRRPAECRGLKTRPPARPGLPELELQLYRTVEPASRSRPCPS